MTSVIRFMTSTLFCRTTCDDDSWKCNGRIDCFWLSPHDEANCSQQCPSYWPIPCACNKPLGNMACAGYGRVCYRESGKLLVLFYFYNVTMTNFRKRHNCRKMKQSEFGFERLLNCDVTITSLKQFIQSN